MKHALAVAALSVATVSPVVAAAAGAAPVPGDAPYVAPPRMTVSGDGLIERSPDLARVDVQIVTNDDVASRSSGKNADAYAAFKARLAPIGLAPDAIRTTYFNVEYVPYPPKGLPPEQRQPRYGYVTTRSLSIAVSPIENAGKVVDAATAAGLTQAGNLRFELKDRKAAYREALAAAMRDARANANALAAGGGFTIVRIASVSTNGFVPTPRPIAMMRAAASLAQAPPAPTTDLESAGPIDVTAHVDVSYEIR